MNDFWDYVVGVGILIILVVGASWTMASVTGIRFWAYLLGFSFCTAVGFLLGSVK